MSEEAVKRWWWGYLHSNGTLQVKRWYGDHADYTTDCEGNDFVHQVVPPFEAPNRDEALKHIQKAVFPSLYKD